MFVWKRSKGVSVPRSLSLRHRRALGIKYSPIVRQHLNVSSLARRPRRNSNVFVSERVTRSWTQMRFFFFWNCLNKNTKITLQIVLTRRLYKNVGGKRSSERPKSTSLHIQRLVLRHNSPLGPRTFIRTAETSVRLRVSNRLHLKQISTELYVFSEWLWSTSSVRPVHQSRGALIFLLPISYRWVYTLKIKWK